MRFNTATITYMCRQCYLEEMFGFRPEGLQCNCGLTGEKREKIAGFTCRLKKLGLKVFEKSGCFLVGAKASISFSPAADNKCCSDCTACTGPFNTGSPRKVMPL